jgi:transcriptional antiterminator NusG
MDEREEKLQPEEEPREPGAEPAGEPQAPQAGSPRDESAEMEPAEPAAEPAPQDEVTSPQAEQEDALVEASESGEAAADELEAVPSEPVETPEGAAPAEAQSAEEQHEQLHQEIMAEAPPSQQPELMAAEAVEEQVEQAPVSRSRGSERRGSLPQGEMPPDASSEPAWYVIHCYSGYENKVRHNLEQRIETMGMKDKIFDVVIPTQEEIEVREGKRRTVERHIFPGYVLVNMSLSEESWYVVRNTPGVTGFVGMGNLPTALRPEEVSQIIKRMEADAPTVKVSFKEGERVRIIDGPFNDFRGTVSEIDMERTKVRVMVSFFGRETPVELDFLQVEKA